MQWIRWAVHRLIKCRACGELVPDDHFCISCGSKLK